MLRYILVAIATFAYSAQAETIQDNVRGMKFAYEVYSPNISDPVPVIISLHGSSRDGQYLSNGVARTDEYTTRIIKEGNKRGFAVVAIDAFYQSNLQPHNKTMFPAAWRMAVKIKSILEQNPNYTDFYLTGFSYGAGQTMSVNDARLTYKKQPWKAVAGAAPGCNRFSEPVKFDYPIAIFKGEKDHYSPRACKFYANMLIKANNNVTFEIIPKVNHFFSTDEGIVDGKAQNGCTDNPIIRYPDGSMKFLDGTGISKRQSRSACLTNQSGKGKDRLKLDIVVKKVVTFFEKM
jgi:dienelactone hydrolase